MWFWRFWPVRHEFGQPLVLLTWGLHCQQQYQVSSSIERNALFTQLFQEDLIVICLQNPNVHSYSFIKQTDPDADSRGTHVANVVDVPTSLPTWTLSSTKLPYERRYRHVFRRPVQRPSACMDLRGRLLQMPDATGSARPGCFSSLRRRCTACLYGDTHTYGQNVTIWRE